LLRAAGEADHAIVRTSIRAACGGLCQGRGDTMGKGNYQRKRERRRQRFGKNDKGQPFEFNEAIWRGADKAKISVTDHKPKGSAQVMQVVTAR
jgi:hypothetical protein